MKKYRLSALVAAGLLVGGLSAGSASAADLGGNCCADLEERIAELEATTARKGNRKVSLTISGWVAEQVMWWDDGEEQNVYVGGIGTTLASHFKMTGQATISPGWYAGYVLHVELNTNDSLTQDQGRRGLLGTGAQGPAVDPLTQQGNFTGPVATVLQSYWFVKSDHLGKLGVGRQSQASDNAAILVDGSGSLVPANWVAFETNAFQIYDKNGNATGFIWGGVGSCRGMGGAWGDCNGLTRNAVRYDTPTFHGFSLSASWGDDDFWDVAARYSGEYNGFKLAAAAAYNQWTDGNYLTAPIAGSNFLSGTYPNPGSSDYFQAGVYVEHVPTGLWGLINYGHLDDSFSTLPSTDTWYFKAGLRERWHPLGHTVLYGEYETVRDAYQVESGDFRLWGIGVVQEIDAAAMSLWLSYRNIEADDHSQFAIDEFGSSEAKFQYIKAGALINF
jgi:hypothetical protein